MQPAEGDRGDLVVECTNAGTVVAGERIAQGRGGVVPVHREFDPGGRRETCCGRGVGDADLPRARHDRPGVVGMWRGVDECRRSRTEEMLCLHRSDLFFPGAGESRVAMR